MLEANNGLDPKLTEAEVEATLPLLSARTPAQPYGYMDPEEWGDFAGWMRDNGLIESLPQPSELLSNAYLLGRNPRIAEPSFAEQPADLSAAGIAAWKRWPWA